MAIPHAGVGTSSTHVRVRRAIRAAGLAALLLPTLLLAKAPQLPDPTSGVINGRVAILVAPGAPGPAGRLEPIDSSGCSVRLYSLQDLRTRTYKCGAWFQPPTAGRYLHWLEQGSSISVQSLVRYRAETFTGRGLSVLTPMTPAGQVRIDSRVTLNPGDTLRVVSLANEDALRPFTRRLDDAEGREPVLAPAGPFIAGAFTREGDALALSRPATVTHRDITTVSIRRPPDGSDLLVTLTRSAGGEQRCKTTFTFGDRSVPPHVDFQAPHKMIFVWYALEAPAKGSVNVHCGHSRLQRQIVLQRGRVVTVRDELN